MLAFIARLQDNAGKPFGSAVCVPSKVGGISWDFPKSIASEFASFSIIQTYFFVCHAEKL